LVLTIEKCFYLENKIKPCELKLKKVTDFQIHHWTEAGKKNFKCVVCGLKYGTYNAMYLHIIVKHPEKKFVKCKLCDVYIDAEIGRHAHFDEFHKGEISTSLKTNALKCQFCEKIFIGRSRKYQRSQHIKNNHSDIAVRCAAFNCCR
jgi:transcription elongation factor Elf1